MPFTKDSADELRSRFNGSVLMKGGVEYDAVRKVFNTMIDKAPSLIAVCSDPNDVISAVNFARSNDLPVAVRGGGHSIGGKSICNDGLLIDLANMKAIEIDPEKGRARAQPGVLLGELDEESAKFGLATPLGTVSVTGISGLTLGGGLGWLNGKFGLSCDNLLSANVVTADGQLLHADDQENPDLLWALRGGSGNFGVVTSLEFALHPCDQVMGGMCLYPFEKARDVIRFFLDFSEKCPDELSTMLALLTGPDGIPVVAIAVCHCGSSSDASGSVAPLKKFGPPIADLISAMKYTDQQKLLDGAFPEGRRHYWKSAFAPKEFSDDGVDIMVELASSKPSPYTIIYLQQIHGAAARVATDETAFPHRGYRYDFAILSQWDRAEDDEVNTRWTKDYFETIKPHLDQAVYVNNLGEEGSGRAREAYGSNYERLALIKKKYDRTNFFKMNQNIVPADSG